MQLGNYIDVGNEIQVQNKSMRIYPLFYQGSHARQYRMVEEIADQVRMVDSGRIDNVYITNNSKHPVFIRAGNIITGATQNRSIKRSIIVFPKSKNKGYSDIEYTKTAEVYCVHASHPINSSGTFGVSCLAPHVFDSMSYTSANQNQIWLAASSYCGDIQHTYSGGPSSAYASVGSDNLDSKVQINAEKYKSTTDKILEGHPELYDAVGIAICDSVGILAIELYDSQESWGAICRKIIEKYSPDFSRNDSTYTTGNHWKHMVGNIKSILVSKFSVLGKFADSLSVDGVQYVTATYQGNVLDKYEAEMTKLNNKVIHLSVVRGTKYSYSESGPLSTF